MANKKYTLEYIRENGLILLDAISGSRAYGTNIPSSDTDYRGIYICELDDYLCGNYPEQISDETNDVTFYEIGRYFELLIKNNPNILELLNVPQDCIQFRHGLMDLIKSEDYVSKLCKNSVGGYATTQIKKARGLGKKIVNPVDEKRKSPLEFCYVIDGHKSYPLDVLLKEKGMDQLFCGVVDVPNSRDLFALYYDWGTHMCFSDKVDEKTREAHKASKRAKDEAMGLGYKGILKRGEKVVFDEYGNTITVEDPESFESSTLRLSSIPKAESDKVVCLFSYNKDSYTQHCKAYKEYWDWVEKRNEQRYNVAAKANYDAKNMMHCYRLAQMSIEIAEGKGIIVRRPNREFLLKIRNGEMTYDEILELNEDLLKQADEAFAKSIILNKPDIDKARETEIELRKRFYGI